MADTPIDTLIIDIEAKASNADKAIDKFANAIGNLANSLARVDTGKLNSVGNGIQRLSSSLQTMKSIDTRSINSVVNKINSLSAIDTSKFATVSANLHQMANGIQSLGTVSANVASVGELAKNISKLGNKSVQTAITNIPQLATALNGLMATLSKAPRVSQNVIQMTNALANLTAQGSKVGSTSNSIVKGLNRASSSTTRANKSFKGLASTFGKFYANCFLMIRGLKGLWNSINSTADYLEAFNYFEVALNKVGGDWAGDWEKYSKKLGVTSAEEYANSFKTRLNESLKGLSGVQISIDANGKTGLLTDTGMKNLGLNIQEVTQYASQLASVTNSVGQTGEVTLATASAFTKLGADMSSLFNVDYSSVMNNLQSGLIGQSRALYKYGIDITNATLQTYAYELGVEKAVSEMTQAEKMQLRMIAILDQSRVSWGDQANTINSLSNSIRQFKNNISEAGQILGQLFVPIMSKLMPVINGVTIAIKRLMVSVAGIMGIKLDLSEFGQGTSGVEEDIDGITDAYDDATAAAKKFSTTTLGIDELNINAPQTDTSGETSGGVSGGLDLTDEILKATGEYEKAWQEAYDRMQNKAEEFSNRITALFDDIANAYKNSGLQGIGEFFSSGLTNALDSIPWETIYEKASGFGIGLASFLNGLIKPSTFKKLGGTVAKSINTALNFLNDFGKKFDWNDFGNSLSSSIKGFFETWDAGLTAETLSTFANGILVAAKSAIDELGENNTFEDIGQKLVDFICGIDWGGIVWNLAGLIKSLNDAMTDLPSDLFEGIVQGIADKIFGEGNIEINLDWLGNILGFINPLEGALGKIYDLIQWFSGDTMQPISDFFQGLLQTASDVFSNLWENIVFVWSGVSTWFSENVIEPVAGFFLGLSTRIQQIFEGLWIIVQGVWETVSGWFNTNVIEPLINTFSPIVEEIGNFFSDLWTDIEIIWAEVSNWFSDTIITPVTNAFDDACEEIGGFFTSLWDGIKKGVAVAMNAVIGAIEGGLNWLVDGINKIIGGFNKVVSWAASIIEVDWEGVDLLQEVSLGRIDVSGFELGGFPKEYSLFMAGERGTAEMLGTVGGKTAVAGGAEITGISSAVYSTSEQELRELREMNSLLRQLLEKDTSVNIGDREIYKAGIRGSKSYGRLLVT